jgi:fructosamine-3-kinase
VYTPGGEPVLIDPAAYHGNREVDLAMMRLFGGFERIVYDAHDEAFPLAEGWVARQDIYNLYHVLHHALVFGGAYMAVVLPSESAFQQNGITFDRAVR